MASEPLDPDEDPVRANRGIIIVVVALGVLLIAGVAGLIYGIVTQMGKPEAPAEIAAPVAPAAPVPRLEPVPPGAAVRGMTAADGVLYLHLVLPDGREVVRAYDRDGTPLFEIDPTAPMP
jgi:hypothetical protein